MTSAQLSFEEYKFFAHTYMCASHYLKPVYLVSGRRQETDRTPNRYFIEKKLYIIFEYNIQ